MDCYRYQDKVYSKEELISYVKENKEEFNYLGAKWRYEITDDLNIKATSGVDIVNELYKRQEDKGAQLTLDEIVSEELKKAYPSLKEVRIVLSGAEDGTIAYYENKGLSGKGSKKI